jgi:hypothetical protein
MVDFLNRSSNRRRFAHLRTRLAVTFLELLCAVILAGVILAGIHVLQSIHSRAQRANTVAEMLRWEITVARGYAVRSGRPMTLVVDEATRSVTLRDGAATWRHISLGEGAPLQVERLTLGSPGDSLVFSPRGVCVTCGGEAPTEMSIEAEGRSALVRVGLVGRAEVAPAAGSDPN